MIHVRSSEASLTTLPGLAISIRHKELGVLVAPPLALSGDRADLLGDDALLVGQTYVCEVSELVGLGLTLTLTLTLTLAPPARSARRGGASRSRRPQGWRSAAPAATPPAGRGLGLGLGSGLGLGLGTG